jgi:hypothetical protein
MTWTIDTDNAPELRGLLLRYAAILVMEGVTRPTSVGEIVEAIERLGVRVPERKGKWVSDALRCEHRKGRVRRVGRDQYIGGTSLPGRTRRRARRALADARRTGIGSRALW